MDIEKILKLLEADDAKPVVQKRGQVAKESLIAASGGSYEAINNLLEEDLLLDTGARVATKSSANEAHTGRPNGATKHRLRYAKEEVERRRVGHRGSMECGGAADATIVDFDHPVYSPVLKRKHAGEDIDEFAEEIPEYDDDYLEIIENIDDFEFLDDYDKTVKAGEYYSIVKSRGDYFIINEDGRIIYELGSRDSAERYFDRINRAHEDYLACLKAKSNYLDRRHRASEEDVRSSMLQKMSPRRRPSEESRENYSKRASDEAYSSIGQDLDEYQKWVDYDMKHFGRVSKITNRKLKEAGLQLVKDREGDYEVIADDYRHASESGMSKIEANNSRMLSKLRDDIDARADDRKEYAKKLASRIKDDADSDRDYSLKRASSEELVDISKKESAFPQELNFDEEAFAELFDLNVEEVSAQYLAEEDNIPEHIEIRFIEDGKDVVLKIHDDGSLEEVVDARIIEPSRFCAIITVDDSGEYQLLISDCNDSVKVKEEDEILKSEEDEISIDEDGNEDSKEFVEVPGLNLDEYYSRQHGIKPAKDAGDLVGKKTNFPVSEAYSSAGQDLDEYQKWVDYDMRRFGRVSDITRSTLKKAGLQLVEDQHGDYEVIANDYEHSAKEDTIKTSKGWTNKGEDGTHGTFKTKKEADDQRAAMFANGFKSRR